MARARAKDLKAELGALAREHGDVRERGRGRGRPAQRRARASSRPGASCDALIQDQHWRAAHFRVAADDINYRRFFNINELAGLRMELPEVFEHAHRLVFELLRDGVLDGLRIDHIDGLLDPKGYLLRLREAGAAARSTWWSRRSSRGTRRCARTGRSRARPATNSPIWCSACWSTLPARRRFTRAYRGVHRRAPPPSREIVRDCKIRIMVNEMASELNVLARDAGRVARQNPRTADFTRNILQRALQADHRLLSRSTAPTSMPPPSRPKRTGAISTGRWPRHGAIEPERRSRASSTFCTGCSTTDLVAQPRSGFSRQAVVRFAMRVQQYSGPVMAKGLEDTAFYRYNRFVALNEVGGHPDQFGVPLAAFHRANAQRAAALAARNAGHLYPRYQARRGYPRPPCRAGGDAGGMGCGRSMPGAGSCALAAATSKARHRQTAATSTCSTSFCSALGRRSWPASTRSTRIRCARLPSGSKAP